MDSKAVILQKEEHYRLTLEALDDVDNGRLIDHQAVVDWVDSLSREKKLPLPVPEKQNRILKYLRNNKYLN